MAFDQESLIRSIAVAGPKKYMLFCGAGTSASSGIPTASQCVWRWKQEIYLSKHPHLKPTLLLDATLPWGYLSNSSALNAGSSTSFSPDNSGPTWRSHLEPFGRQNDQCGTFWK
jgi:hypothetical protein